MRLELAEEVQLRRFAGIAVFLIEKMLGEVKEDRRAAHVVEVLDGQVHALADDALVLGDGRADKSGRQLQHRILVEFRRELLVRQLDAIAFDAREADFERVALRADRMDADGLARLGRRRDDGLRREVEGDAENVGIFDVEQAVFIQIVGLAAQAAADDLLAQKLRAEGADAENVRDGVRVPAFRQHRDGNDAAHLFAQADPSCRRCSSPRAAGPGR